ncbi:MAG: glycosyltransferase family 39 protein [Anaerolineae bacterium]
MDRVKPYVPFGLVAIILVGYFLRIYHLGVVPLRGDEAFSIQYWAGIPLSKSLSTIAAIEPHPFLAYVAFRAWGLLVGDSEFGMRYLPAIANTIGIASLYALGKRLGGWRLGLVAALLFMLHPYEIWHAQDAELCNMGGRKHRNGVAWDNSTGLEKRQAWVLYTVIAAIAANIFYSELFTLAALPGVFVVVTRWREKAYYLGLDICCKHCRNYLWYIFFHITRAFWWRRLRR